DDSWTERPDDPATDDALQRGRPDHVAGQREPEARACSSRRSQHDHARHHLGHQRRRRDVSDVLREVAAWHRAPPRERVPAVRQSRSVSLGTTAAFQAREGREMIAAIYARKSTSQSDVADVEKSVTRQITLAKQFAAERGWTVIEEYVDDGISGQ